MNLDLYNKYKSVPDSAKKTIRAGRLKGMTDINPMWRIKCLTEEFGPCGTGWYAKPVKVWTETGANGEVGAFMEIHLFTRKGEKWSAPIVGIGGAALVAKESSGLYFSDEAFKMAYTDAISVCCKLLGFGADVYWEVNSENKYHPYTATPRTKDSPNTQNKAAERLQASADTNTYNRVDSGGRERICEECGAGLTSAQRDLSIKKFNRVLCPMCQPK